MENLCVVGPKHAGIGRVTVVDGMIEAIDIEEADSGAREGDYLIPGLIDIHTDNLEKHFLPRPNSPWETVGAALAHDGQVAAAGITTVLDSLSAHGKVDGHDRDEIFPELIGALDEARANDALRVDHLLHLRCEVTYPQLHRVLDQFGSHDQLALLSVMDHTPGQGQTGDLTSFRNRLRERGMSDAEIDTRIHDATHWRDPGMAEDNRASVFQLGTSRGIPVASHDDREADEIDRTKAMGGTIAEFPLTLNATRRAKESSMWTVFGAPNFVRGRSHGGNVSARDVARENLLDTMCSDYIPHALLRAAFMLIEPPFEWSISRAIATVTSLPAALAGLSDRGEIQPGKRADLVKVHYSPGKWPIIKGVWCKGQRVA